MPRLITFLQTIIIKICQDTKNTYIDISTSVVLCLSLLFSVLSLRLWGKKMFQKLHIFSFEGNL